MDTRTQDEMGGQWQNNRTGEYANGLPSHIDSAGHYSDYPAGQQIHIWDRQNDTAAQHNNDYGQAAAQWWHN